MKTKQLFASAICLASIVFAGSCKKYNNSNSGTYTVPHLNTLFADLKSPPQSFSVPVGIYHTVQGANGTIINFYPNSFKDASGHILTSGNVSIQLTEIYKPGDMIRNRTSGTANGRLLASGGEVNITATMGGQTIYANKYSIAYNQPAGSVSTGMQLFYGNNSKADSLVRWSAADSVIVDSNRLKDAMVAGYDSTGNVRFMPVATGTQAYYIFDSCTNFNFTNCDQFYGYGTLATVNVIVPDTSFNPSNTEIYVVLPTLNCVLANSEMMGDYTLGGLNYSSTTNTFAVLSEGNTAIVPVGQAYKLVVITLKNGNYYYYETSGTVPANLSVTATMTAKSRADVITNLDAL